MYQIDDHNPNSKVLTCCPECARLLLRYQIAAPEDKAIWQERIDAHIAGGYCLASEDVTDIAY